MPTCLIVGATRGIGSEFARQYAADGWRVLGTYRRAADGPELARSCARAIEIDLLRPDWPKGLDALRGETLDLVILAAGVVGPRSEGLLAPDPAEFDVVLHTNVLSAMRLIPALAESLIANAGKLVVLSSRMGSIGNTTNASRWLYRASKAALNSVLKSASIELGACGVVCLAMHPGWVRTDMGGVGADLEVADSVASMRRVIAGANRSHNGRFLNFSGEQLEW